MSVQHAPRRVSILAMVSTALLVSACTAQRAQPPLDALVLASAARPVDPPREPGPALWAGLKPGPYPVGYRRLETAGVVHVWYPIAATGTRLRIRDYLGDEAAPLAAFLTGTGIERSTVDSLLASPLFASSSVPTLDRAFPLVLIAQGNGQDVIDQVVLCEYLASQGLVVAATPSPMRKTPIEREDQIGVFAEQQATDLAAAIGAASALAPVDTARLGIVGHSFGARAALLLAMQDRRVQAIVSLDGGIGTATGVQSFRGADSFRADAALPPLLHFYEDLDSLMRPDFTLLRELHTTDLKLVRTEGMRHVHFTTYGFAAAVFPAIASVTRATPVTSRSVVGVAEQTATFLRQGLR